MNMAPTADDSLTSCLVCGHAITEGTLCADCKSTGLDDEIDCPANDPSCEGGDGDCHDACEAPSTPTIYAYKYRRPNVENTPFVLNRDPRALTTFNGESWHIAKQFRSNGWFGPCTDLKTGRALMFRPSGCGSEGCYCAAEWKLARKSKVTV
jgi:hypothetical protein